MRGFGRGDERRDRCGLCGKPKEQVPKLIVGLHSAVCSECVDLCNDILQNETSAAKSGSVGLHTPPTDLRRDVCVANRSLPTLGLVTVHSGNVSGYDKESGVVFIKPSGMDYDAMTPRDMVAVSLDGDIVEKGLKPSVDLPHHLYVYNHMPDVRAVVHTHSNFATAFAACHKPIPVVLTAIADEFGGQIPCAPYVDNEGDHIGQAILAYKTQAPAVLLGNHGVFAWGRTVAEALKAAAMVEDVAKTVWLSYGLGGPVPLDPEEAAKWFDRYQNRYGQE